MKKPRLVDEAFALRLMLRYRDGKLTDLGLVQACMEEAGVWSLPSTRDLRDRLVAIDPSAVEEQVVKDADAFLVRVAAHVAAKERARERDPNTTDVYGNPLVPGTLDAPGKKWFGR